MHSPSASDSRPLVVCDFTPEDRFGELVGQSSAMRAVFRQLRRNAAHDLTMLIAGESGTGKELAARAIHATSARADGPFVVFDCGAVSANLVESELFGVAKGAYTGAEQERSGVAVAAHGGTLFLDEVGELPLDLQPKLLRLLDRHELRRLGESTWREVDVRIVAATHRNLVEDVKAGRFRRDLYHRLAVAEIRLPALRERPDDIPLLIRHLLAQEQGWKGELPPPALLRDLATHAWPGNVRELRNVVLRWLYFASGVQAGSESPRATTRHLLHGAASPPPGRPSGPAPEKIPSDFIDLKTPLPLLRERWHSYLEPRYLRKLLEDCDGNVSEAARRADVARKTIYEMLRRHGIKRKSS